MKKGIALILMALAILCFACNNDDHHNTDKPDKEIVKAFQEKYPGVNSVDWSKQTDYQIAEFIYGGNDTKAWFYKDGTYLLSVAEITYAALPAAITGAVSEGTYSTWRADDDAWIIESAAKGKYYGIEVEKQGTGKRELYYDATGLLRLEVVEEYDGDEFPVWMNSFLKQKYPHAVYLEGEKLLDGMYMAYFLETTRLCTVRFYRDQEWWYTAWPVVRNEVPAVVLEVFQEEAYQNFQIRTIEYRQTAAGDYYYFDLCREGSVDIKVKVNPQGQIVLN